MNRIFYVVIATASVAHSRKFERPQDDSISNYVEWRMNKNDDYDYKYTNESDNYRICDTPECKKVAQEFLTSINKSLNPCDDFYEFACSGWKINNPIPPSLASWSRFSIFENTVKHRIKGILEMRPTYNDILSIRQAKKWYRSCMNIVKLERKSIEPIESILVQTGGWPIAMDDEEWNEESSWQNVDRHYARLTGSYAFHEIDSDHKLTNNGFGEINILPAELPLSGKLPDDYRNYEQDDYEAYIQLVEEVVLLFVHHNRAIVPKRRIRQEAENLVKFENQIEGLRQQVSKVVFMTLDEMVKWYEDNMTELHEDPKTRIEWKLMVQNLFDLASINVDGGANLFFSNIGYLLGIPTLLKETQLRTIVNYIHWRFVANMLTYTSETMRQKYSNIILEKIYGIEERPPRWLECIDEMKMTHSAAFAFVDNYFTEDAARMAVDVVENVRSQLAFNMNQSNWLDPESKVIMIGKLNNMKMLIGFPDWYKNESALVNYYKGLTIGTGYFDNVLSGRRFEKIQQLKRHVTLADNSSWYIDPITVNAMYGRYDNALNMPAVAFQSPLFTKGLPESINYGIVGVLIGHEMGHAFDDCAIRYGKYGNDTELAEAILKSYYERAECFVGQMNGYYGKTIAPIEEPWNCKDSKESEGERTAGENIADTTGLQAVFQAYKKMAEGKVNEKEARLPGLEEFTDFQLFFISFADMFCEIETPKFAELRDRSEDVHSPVHVRVNGALSNTDDFAKVFNCPLGSEMNPRDKCDIWTKPKSISKMRTGSKKRPSWIEETKR